MFVFPIEEQIYQALTLVHILPREGELRYDCVKTRTIKRYFNLISFPFFKNTSENIRTRGSDEMLMLVLSGIKAMKMLNFVN